MKKLVIFDLDGTLLNTIADLAHSTNHALRELGIGAHPLESYPYFVGNGIRKLFERALPATLRTQEMVEKVRTIFLAYYDVHNTDETTIYPGVAELLRELQNRGVQIAVASNKYQSATEKLMQEYFPEIHFVSILGQREGIPPKPDAGIVKDTLKSAGVTEAEALYVGDSGVDMQTASNSGVESVGVTWGFRPMEELQQSGAKHLIENPKELIKWIEK